MTISADLQNANNWELVFNITKDAEYTSTATHKAIPEIVVPTYLSSSLIATFAESNNVSPSWYTAGYLTRFISIGLTVGNNQNTKIGISKRVPLREASVIQFDTFNENYKLVFRPYKGLDNVSFTLWKYIGEIVDSTEDQIDLARIDVLRLEKKINIILQQSL